MAFEDFVITRLAGWGADLTVRIECDPSSSHWVKLGLAVRVAHANRARLDGASLDGASLVGASLVGARLDGASLVGASLDGASLVGALYLDKTIKRMFACAIRMDGYAFYAFECEDAEVYIKAGCRWFTPTEFRSHITAEYPGTDKALETGRILGLIEGRMADLGIGVEKPKHARKVAT